MKILNIFVSQPMSGIALEEIEKKRNFIVSRVALSVEKKTGLTWKVDFDISVVNPIVRNETNKFKKIKFEPVWYLGRAISDMSKCECIIFDKDATNEARGCKCEYYVAKEYKKDCYSVTSPILGEVSKYLQDK